MNTERTQAYGRVVRTLEDLGPTKLQPAEQARIREAADTLIFAAGIEEARAALEDVETLAEHLVASDRWSDELALGNITGAMSFQASIPVALGLVFTSWQLETPAVVAALCGLAGGLLARWALPRGHVGKGAVAAWGGLFVGFVVYAALSG